MDYNQGFQQEQKNKKIISNPFNLPQSNDAFQNIEINQTIPNQQQNQQPTKLRQPFTNPNQHINNQPQQEKQYQPLQFQQPNDLSGNINLTQDLSKEFFNQDVNQNNQPQQQQQQNIYSQQPQNIDEFNDPPLLEDLGIDLENIKQKTKSILTFQKCDDKFIYDPDMSGPLLLGFALGILLMLSGKIHFGYIYGFGACGVVALYVVLNLLSQKKHVPLYNVLSILGYCLLPIVILSLFNVFFNLRGGFGMILAVISIGWSTYVAATFFERILELTCQKYLAAYPIFLFYFTFVLITVF